MAKSSGLLLGNWEDVFEQVQGPLSGGWEQLQPDSLLTKL
jgi:hypothetical protein